MFNKARIQLTVWYLLIIMTISISFSFVIYHILGREIERFARIQRVRIEIERSVIQPPPHPPEVDPVLVAESRQRLLRELIVVNGIIFILSGGLGFFLAGKTLQPIKDMVDEQGRFISDASHELRTPLTSLKTTMEVALRDKDLTLVSAQKTMKENIMEVDRLQRLSEELLQLARYEKTKTVLKPEIVSLPDLIHEAVKKILPLADQKQIRINNMVKGGSIITNRFNCVDLLVIFLDNAVKYSHSRGVITISAKKNDGKMNIFIKDMGIGIGEDDLPHIFDRFYRADSARSKASIGGYGLGLSIAKKIVEELKGSIRVESKIHKGTTAIISLPASKE